MGKDSSSSSSSLAYGPYSSTSASFRVTAHADLSSAFFLHLSTPTDFRSFLIQFSHFNFGDGKGLLGRKDVGRTLVLETEGADPTTTIR
jgi:hypothetical protein